MKSLQIPHTNLESTRLIYGCMMIGGQWQRGPLDDAQVRDGVAAVEAAVEAGITFFDHANIYQFGKSEEVFAEALRAMPDLRERIVLQSKCGLRWEDKPSGAPWRYDFSCAHILEAVDGILSRLGVEQIDILLLHRPDALIEPQEVAAAFDALRSAGKVQHFGVSNHTPRQIDLLQHALDQPLVANQIQLSLVHHFPISEGLTFNRALAGKEQGYAGTEGIVDYCRLHDISIQAWSPVAGGVLFNPGDDASPAVRHTAALVAEMAAEKETTREAIALGWLLRHPAPIWPVIGTTKPERIHNSAQADAVELSHAEWYRLLEAMIGRMP